MMKKRRGQFQILAAFLVISILSAAVMTSYNRTQENSRVEPVTIANTVNEVNGAVQELLQFSTGYYSSLIKVTGDYDYAQKEATTYLNGGLEKIAQSHPDWGISFNYSPNDLSIQSDWYNSMSSTKGEWNITYSIPTIGLLNIKLKTVAECRASIINTEKQIDTKYWSNVKVDAGDHPNLQLAKKNFQFFTYNGTKRTWQTIPLTTEPILTTEGLYQIQIPEKIDHEVYYIQVEDQNGIISQTGFIQGKPNAIGSQNKDKMSYTYHIDWGTPNPFTDIKDLFTLELLQNGTIRWLGHRLPVKNGPDLTAEKPIPPLPVTSLHVSAFNGVKWVEIPFQVEDWANDYQVPLGLTNSKAIFNENCMLVFQIDHTYTDLDIWWDGKSSQTSPPPPISPFINDNPAGHTLNNGKISMNTNLYSGGGNYIKTSIPSTGVASASVTANFFRFNGNQDPIYGSDMSFIITNGIVRDIIQQEPEFSGGITGTPDTLTHIVITLPAGTTYYTYKLRSMFLDTASTLNRMLTELSVISIQPSNGTTIVTENGLTGSNPIISNNPGYYGKLEGSGIHRWSQLITSGKGAGIMMHNDTLSRLYAFDESPVYRGNVQIDNTKIEINPVKNLATTNVFSDRRDITINGAVVLFDGTSSTSPIYDNTSNKPGLSLMVDQPPSFTSTLGTSYAPNAVNDLYTTSVSTQLVVSATQGVLANDYDPDSNLITAAKVTDPTHGTVTLNPNGSFTYIPTAGYAGSDSFTYKANDGSLDSNVATVTVSVGNQAPVAINDTYSTNVSTQLVVNAVQGVLANDYDPNSNPITAVKVTDPSHGVLTVFGSNGSFTYTPTVGYAGSDSFTYKANDGSLDSNIATVTLTVNAGALDHFVFSTISSPQTAGTAFSVTITAVDLNGNTVTSYADSTTLTETGGGAGGSVIQSPVTFAGGTWAGSLTLTKSGTLVTITASGGGKTGVSNPITVNAGTLDHFVFSTISSPQTAGTAFSVTITAVDLNGNTVTNYVGINALTASAGIISPASTPAFTAGVWTGSVTLMSAGAGRSIGTTGSTKSGTSGTFTVNAGTYTMTLLPEGNAGTGSEGITSSTSTSGSHWISVSDSNDITYVYTSSTTLQTDYYITQDPSTTLGTINSVTVYVRCQRGSGNGNSYATPVLRLFGSILSGPSATALGNNWSNLNWIYARSWTWADINALQCGVSLTTDNSRTPRCAQVWVVINYTIS